VAEGGGLLNRCTVKSCTQGSNPCLSARQILADGAFRVMLLHVFGKPARVYLIIVLAFSAIIIFGYGQIQYTRPEFSGWDVHAYRAMAMASPGLSANVPTPFAYRILGPYLVGLLPVAPDTGFYVLTVISVLILSGLLYAFLSYEGIQYPVAALATIFFLCNKYFVGYIVWSSSQIDDTLAFILILILFWAMQEGKWRVFALGLFVGSMTRETSLLVAPVAFAFLWEKGRLKADWRKAAIALVPAIGGFLVLRWAIQVPGPSGLQAALRFYFETFLGNVGKLGTLEGWLRVLVNSFSPFSLVPLLYWKNTRAFFAAGRYRFLFVGLVFFSDLFGASNERLMAPAFIVFYLLIAAIIQDCHCQRNWLLAVFVAGALLSSLHHLYGRYPLPNRACTVALTLGSLLLVTLATFLFKVLGSRNSSTS
jgi:hypothetical protein